MPHAQSPTKDSFQSNNNTRVEDVGAEATSRRLVLFFDGTGNQFSGTNSDTNVVKLFEKLNRDNPTQLLYYQSESAILLTEDTSKSRSAGIGTYSINETTVNKTFIGDIQSSVSQTIDQGIGTTFDAHVMAGYRFLMRYYDAVSWKPPPSIRTNEIVLGLHHSFQPQIVKTRPAIFITRRSSSSPSLIQETDELFINRVTKSTYSVSVVELLQLGSSPE
jgi:hypothetical protein